MEPCLHRASEWGPWWLSSVLMTSKGLFYFIFIFFGFDELSQSEINQMLMSFFWFCRNFDEVLSSFAEPLMENTPFSESCSSFYDEEHFKVSSCDCIRRTGLNNRLF